MYFLSESRMEYKRELGREVRNRYVTCPLPTTLVSSCGDEPLDS